MPMITPNGSSKTEAKPMRASTGHESAQSKMLGSPTP